jgi:hypothetical protein
VAEAPAASAPTAAVPATVPPTLTASVVAAAAAVPALRTVAETVTSVASLGDAGDQVRPVTTRSGFGAQAPITCISATWPPGAPVLAKNCSCTSATRPATGMVTVFRPAAGLKV